MTKELIAAIGDISNQQWISDPQELERRYLAGFAYVCRRIGREQSEKAAGFQEFAIQCWLAIIVIIQSLLASNLVQSLAL